MSRLLLIFILSIFISVTAGAQASKTVLISDIDDTLKVAHTFGFLKGVQYFRDTKLRFTGMSEVYALLQKDQPGLRTYYVSVAPRFLMEKTHKAFLKNAHFPEGTYLGRSQYSADLHKLESIRSILRQEKPQRAILVGDNGQIDAAVYREISQDAEFDGVEFHQFVHIVSSKPGEDGQGKVSSEQTAYLTSVELAVEMGRQGLLTAASVDFVMKNILPKILREGSSPPSSSEFEFSFPYFIDCRSLVWKWDIPGLNQRVQEFCHLQ